MIHELTFLTTLGTGWEIMDINAQVGTSEHVRGNRSALVTIPPIFAMAKTMWTSTKPNEVKK